MRLQGDDKPIARQWLVSGRTRRVQRTSSVVYKRNTIYSTRFKGSYMDLDFSAPSALLFASVTVASVYAIRSIIGYDTVKLPPGPKGIPFFGNLFQLSTTPWKDFAVWKKQYGTFSFCTPYFEDSQDLWYTSRWEAKGC